VIPLALVGVKLEWQKIEKFILIVDARHEMAMKLKV
jgi:hypothetical protein